ncbi:MAG: hypothetical protein AAGA72_00460 [Pseudomonadota bacterium]
MEIWFASLTAAVILALILAMFRDRSKARTTSEFFLHGQNLRIGALTSTLVSTNLSLGNMIYVCAILGFFFGYSGIFWVIITIISLGLGFAALGGRFKDYIEDRGNFGTLHDFLAKAHSFDDRSKEVKLKGISALLTSIALLLAIIIEIHLGAKFLQLIVPAPLPVIVSLFALLVAAYTASAGFYTVVFTDRIQFALMLLAVFGGVALFSGLPQQGPLYKSGYEFSLWDMFSDVGWPTALGLVCLGFFWLLATPDTWQRNAASRSMATSKAGAAWGTLLMCLWVAAFAFGGMLVKHLVVPLVPETSIEQLSGGYFAFNDIFLLNFDDYGVWVQIGAAVLATGMVMAAISTVDTFLIVIGHVVNVDFALTKQGVGRLDELSDPQNKFVKERGRLFILLSSPIIIIGWFILEGLGWLFDPLSLFFVTYTLQFVLAVPLLAGTFASGRSYRTTLACVSLGATVTAGIGIYGMLNLSSEHTYLGLAPASWLAVLPVLPIIIGVVLFGPLIISRRLKNIRST